MSCPIPLSRALCSLQTPGTPAARLGGPVRALCRCWLPRVDGRGARDAAGHSAPLALFHLMMLDPVSTRMLASSPSNQGGPSRCAQDHRVPGRQHLPPTAPPSVWPQFPSDCRATWSRTSDFCRSVPSSGCSYSSQAWGAEGRGARTIANLPKFPVMELIKRNEPIQASTEITVSVSLW